MKAEAYELLVSQWLLVLSGNACFSLFFHASCFGTYVKSSFPPVIFCSRTIQPAAEPTVT